MKYFILILFTIVLGCSSPVLAQSWGDFGSDAFGGASGTPGTPTSIAADDFNHVYLLTNDVSSISVYKNTGVGEGGWARLGSARFAPVADNINTIAVDNNGTPYVVFRDISTSKASVMKFNGSSWVYVGPSGFSDGTVSNPKIAVYNGLPYVAYTDNVNGGKITVQTFNGTSWTPLGPKGFTALSCVFPDIKIGTDGQPVVITKIGSTSQLIALKFDGSNWNYLGSSSGLITANGGGVSGQKSSGYPFKFVLDNYNNPWMLYSGTSNNLGLMHFTGGSWSYDSYAVGGVGNWDYDITFANGLPYLEFQYFNGFAGQTIESYSNSVLTGTGSYLTGVYSYFSSGGTVPPILCANAQGILFCAFNWGSGLLVAKYCGPSLTSGISGPVQNVCGNSQVTYQIPPVPGATSYKWTLGAGTWSGTSTTNTINVTTGTTNGSVSVYAMDGCGKSQQETLNVTVNSPIGSVGNISGSDSVTVGQNYTYSVYGSSAATSYVWTLPSGWTGASTTNVINVVAGATPGVISVIGKNACVVSASSALNVKTATGPTSAQTITFPNFPSTGYGNSDFDPAAYSSSGLTISYASSNPNVATIVNGLIHITGVGTTNITATQSGNALYLAATAVTQVLTVSQGAQEITFDPLSAQYVGSPDFDPGASVSSGLPPTYTSSNPAIATIVSGQIHIVGAGTCTISAFQAGNQFYAASNTVSQPFTVLNKVSQVITFNTLSTVSYGQTDFSPNASTNSGLPITYTSSDPTIATIVNGLIHIQNIGTVTITATQAGNQMYMAATSSQQLTINMGTEVIIFPFIYNVNYGNPDVPLNAYSTYANIPISYASSDNTVAVVVNGSLHIVGAGTVTITISQGGNGFYNAASSVSRQVTINKATQTISFTLATPISYTTTDFDPAATASSGLLPTYTSSDVTVAEIINGNIHLLKPGTVNIVASQAGDANYLQAPSVTQKLTITRASQMVSFAALRPVSYGSAAITPTVSTSSGLAVTLASSDTLVAKVAGANLVIKGVGQSVITASQAGGIDYTAAAPVAQTLTVNPGSQTITFAALPAKTYGAADFVLAATASSKLPVSYSSSDPTIATVSGSTVHIVSAGTVTITASQAGSTLYNAAPNVSQQLTINPAAQTVIFNTLAAKTYGAADYAPVATVASKLPLSFASSNPAVATIVNGNIHIIGAGTSTITASQAGNTDYSAAAAVSQTLTVNKASLIIKPANQTIIYGAAIPALSLTYTSFVNGDTPASLTTPVSVVTTATTTSPAGSYTITASGAAAANYTITYQLGTLVIAKASQTITFAALAPAAYGGAAINLSGSSSSGLAITYTSSDTTIAKVFGTSLVIRGVGQVTITASQAGGIDYTAAAPVAQTLTVNPGSQTITFAALPAKTYGAADFVLAATASSKLPVSYSSSDPTIATVSGSTVHIVSAGTVTITASQAGSTLYNAAPNVSQQLTINPAAQTVIFNTLAAKTYGAADYAPVATVASKLPLSFASSNPAVATIVNGNIHIIGAGTSTITASQAGNTDYSAAAAVSQTLTVNKASLIIKPANQTIIYGAAIPALSLTYTSFVNGDTPASLTTPVSVVTTATTTSPAGSYTITASGAAAANYTITYQLGTLVIAKASQTITFAALAPAAYGGAAINLSGSSSSGLAITYTSSDTTIAKVFGTSLVIRGVGQVTITASQAGGIDYTAAAPVAQTLTVNPGSQTITFAALPAKTYGAADFVLAATASSKLPVSYSSSDPTIATVSGSTVHIVSAGTVTITASQAGSTLYNAAPNVSQQLTINPAAQTVIFNTLAAKTYGAADYAPVATVASKLPLSFASSNPAVATIVNGNIHIIGAGTSTITASQAGNTDYSAAAAVSQTLTVNKASLIIKPANQTIIYGAAIPALSLTYTSFVNGDTPASLTTPVSVVTTATTTSPAGSYTITASGAAAANYTITYQLGTLVIAKASQTITFAALAPAAYGGAAINLSGSSSSGLAITYTSSDTTIAKVFGTSLVIRGVGQVTITASQAGGIDYTAAAPVAQTLTVNPGSQTITFAALPAKTYGAADFVLAATASSKLPVSYSSSDPTIATVNGSTVHIVSAGTVTITASQAGSTLYNAAPNVSQQLTINPAAQTVIFNTLAAKTYGAADYAPVATVASKLPLSFASSNPAVATIVNGNIHIIGAGTSTITASQAGNTDYSAAAAVSQTLTVNKASLIIKPANQTIIYGAAIPALSLTYTSFVNGDTPASLTTPVSVVTTATTTSPAGSYTITASGAAAANYTITYQLGTLVIAKASQTITFAALAPAAYGGAAINLSGSSSSGLAITYTSSDTTIAKVFGTSLVIRGVGQVTITASQAGGIDYTAAAPVAQTLTVNPGSQTITFAALPAKTYGAADFVLAATASSKLPVSYSSSDPTIATVSGSTVHIVSAGTVTITASQAGNIDYSAAAPVSQALLVNTSALTIKVNSAAKVYGSINPVFTFTYIGFVNGDSNAGLTTQPTVITTATTGSVPGSYALTPGGAVSKNYTISYLAGSMVVSKAALIITANNQTKPAGAANPVLTLSYSGFVNGDSPVNLTTQPTANTTSLTSSPAGTYSITVSGATDPNYAISYVAGTLTVTAGGEAIPVMANETAQSVENGSGLPQPTVRQAISPNGDGINDALIIDGIENYPDNKLTLISRNGQKVFEGSKYDNVNRLFNGHSNITGLLQPVGTYFYLLEYVDKGKTKRKTGFIIIKNN